MSTTLESAEGNLATMVRQMTALTNPYHNCAAKNLFSILSRFKALIAHRISRYVVTRASVVERARHLGHLGAALARRVLGGHLDHLVEHTGDGLAVGQ